jgi:hypothetical protein
MLFSVFIDFFLLQGAANLLSDGSELLEVLDPEW